MNTKQNYNKKLTDTQIEFLTEFGHLVRKWSVPGLAKAFGVSPQAIEYHMKKKEVAK